MLYSQLIEKHLNDCGPAFTDLKNEYSYANLHQMVQDLQNELGLRKAEKGDTVLIINHNTIQTIISILTCISLHICYVIVPEECKDDALKYIIFDAKPKLLIDTNKEFLITETGLENGENRENLTYIIYTSGSTGYPKGVMAPEKNVCFCIEAINQRLMNGKNDRLLCCLPLSFDYGMYQLFLALTYGALLVVPYKPYLQEIPRLLKNMDITAFPAMPAMLSQLLYTKLLTKVQLPNLRYITSTGDNFPVPLIQEIKEACPATHIIPMYGQTECKRVSIMPFGCEEKVLAGSCGIPLNGTKVWIDDPDDNGIGELIVCGPNVMQGYLNVDKEAFGYFFINSGQERCLRTGDLFRMDEDGYLYFVSRKRRIIKINGIRIGSPELEQIFSENIRIPYKEIRVMGIPDRLSGEKILICVSTAEFEETITAEIRRISKLLPKYQNPSFCYTQKEEFPRNINGKTDDKVLMEKAIKNGLITL